MHGSLGRGDQATGGALEPKGVQEGTQPWS